MSNSTPGDRKSKHPDLQQAQNNFDQEEVNTALRASRRTRTRPEIFERLATAADHAEAARAAELDATQRGVSLRPLPGLTRDD